MAMRIAKLIIISEPKISAFRYTLTKPNVAALWFSRPISNNFTSQDSGEDAKTECQEFQKWCKGGGLFHKSACIDPSARIEIGALVHSDSVVGANVYVGSGSVVGPAVTIGQSTRTGCNVVLSNCTIGDFCVIHHGVCIGQDGFGFFVDEQGLMVKKPQCLKARIGNYVEIGANTCIDRGSWRDTVVGDHTKIDNLVQIGHNVEIGKNCMLCGQVGVAGSVTIGDYVILGGRVSIRDHVCISSKVRLAANSCVTKNIYKAGDYGGFPAVPIHEWRMEVVSVRQTSKEFWHNKKKKFASDIPIPTNSCIKNKDRKKERKATYEIRIYVYRAPYEAPRFSAFCSPVKQFD